MVAPEDPGVCCESALAAVPISEPIPSRTADYRERHPAQGELEMDRSAMHRDPDTRTTDDAIKRRDWTKTSRTTISVGGI